MTKKDQKKQIKKNKGYEENLSPDICPKCNGLEFLINEKGNAVPCSCRENMEFLRRLETANIPQKFIEKSLDNFYAKDKMRHDLLIASRGFVSSFNLTDSLRDKKGLLFRGLEGRGKTHLAIGILKEVIKKGYTGYYTNVPDLLSRIRNTYNKDSEENEQSIIEDLINYDLLILDDLGVEAATGWVQERLYLIINNLYQNNKTLIITTNCTLEQLSKQVGQRITSRICELCHEISEFPDEDYRRIMMK